MGSADVIVVGAFVEPGERVDWVRVEDGVVAERGVGRPPVGQTLEFDGILLPGFVDGHVHGALGVDFGDCSEEGARRAADFHHRAGSTTLVATLASAPLADLLEQIRRLAPLVREGVLAGLHLEGPFLAESHRGAHDPGLLRLPDEESVAQIISAGRGAVTTVTVAPEVPGAGAAIRTMVEAGIRVQIGHTGCTADQARAALSTGASGFTHFFNGMPPLSGRSPGAVAAGLTHPTAVLEVIADGVHLDDAAVDVIRTVAPDRTMLVSDAMSACGLGDGSHVVAGSRVEVRGGVARTGEGALAGSTGALAFAVERLADRGATPAELRALSSGTAARTLGLATGLTVGSPADLVQVRAGDEWTRTRVGTVMRHGRILASS